MKRAVAAAVLLAFLKIKFTGVRRAEACKIKQGVIIMNTTTFNHAAGTSVNASITYVDSPIIKVLSDCRGALKWLLENEPVRDVPANLLEQVKCLEKLGIAYRRNNRLFGLRRQRLKRLLEHESEFLSSEYTLHNLLGGEKRR